MPAMNDIRTPDLQRRDSSTSYQVSSFELRAGLEVSLLPATQLPVDLLRELQRLRDCWQRDLAPLPSLA